MAEDFTTAAEKDALREPDRQRLAVIERALVPYEPTFTQLLAGTGVPAERIMRSIVLNCMRNHNLRECSLQSLIESTSTGATLALEADGVTGQGFLVPFDDKRRGKIAQWITGYKGYNTLAYRVGLTVDGAVVREGDEFDYQLGTAPHLHHKPKGSGIDRRITHAWATAAAPGRIPILRVLTRDEVDAIMARSKAANSSGGFSPWQDPKIGYPAMAEKSAKRRLARSMPLSAYVVAARVDEAYEEEGKHAFINFDKDLIIDGKAEPLAHAQPSDDPKGPGRAILEPPSFVIYGLRGEVRTREPTIERWRARMIEAINALSPENLPVFWEKNALILDDLRDQHGEHVTAVGRAYEQRSRK